MTTRAGKAKPRLKRVGFGTWEAVPPKGYRITGSLSFAKNKVFVGIKKLKKSDSLKDGEG